MSGQFLLGTSSICLLLILIAAVLLPQDVQAQASKVSPKLDFDDAENKNNTDIPIVPGTGHGGGVDTDQRNGSEERRGSDTTTSTGSANTGNAKSGPKIHGVRVTVDTGDTQKSKENTESVEITDVGKHKKRVGIHTDITFEISTGSDGNATSSAVDDDKEDASVPIYKGRSGPTQKTRAPYDPKTHWNPNLSSERRSYEHRGHGTGPAYYYPQSYPNNIPVYVTNGDRRSGSGGTGYRRGDGWNSYIPSSNIWTTERNYNEQYRPNAVTGHRNPSWKPCYCMTAIIDNRRRRADHHVPATLPVQPTSSVIGVVDGKLGKPFSNR